MSTAAQLAALLGITAVLCYVAVVSLSNSHTWLGLLALLAAIAALVKLGTILASNLPGGNRLQARPRNRSSSRWWDGFL